MAADHNEKPKPQNAHPKNRKISLENENSVRAVLMILFWYTKQTLAITIHELLCQTNGGRKKINLEYIRLCLAVCLCLRFELQ